jgi:hypothetical protein
MSDATPDNNATEGVDYKFWSQMSGWTVAEAAALLLDIDPDRLPEESDDRGTRGWEYRLMPEGRASIGPRDIVVPGSQG